jgi:hypothetical protein
LSPRRSPSFLPRLDCARPPTLLPAASCPSTVIAEPPLRQNRARAPPPPSLVSTTASSSPTICSTSHPTPTPLCAAGLGRHRRSLLTPDSRSHRCLHSSHRRRTATMSPATCTVARWVAPSAVVLTLSTPPSGAPPVGRHRPRHRGCTVTAYGAPHCAVACGPGMGRIGLRAEPVVLGHRVKTTLALFII